MLYPIVERHLTTLRDDLEQLENLLPRFVLNEFQDWSALRASRVRLLAGEVQWLPPQTPRGILQETSRLLPLLRRTAYDRDVGGALNLHVPLHMLILDGVCTLEQNGPRLQLVEAPDALTLERLLIRLVHRILRRLTRDRRLVEDPEQP